MLEHEALLSILYETKGLSPPDVYILREKERKWAFEKLGLKEEETSISDYILEPISDIHQIVLCNVNFIFFIYFCYLNLRYFLH